jgi:hypothetical protein
MEKDQGSTGSAAPTKPSFMIAVVLSVAAFPSIAVGQKDTGGIAGIVRDPGGAVVSGAKVTVTDVDRGMRHWTQHRRANKRWVSLERHGCE